MLDILNWRFRRNSILYKCYVEAIVVLLLIHFGSAIPIRGAFDLDRSFSSTERPEWPTSSIKQGRQLQTMNPLNVVDKLSPMTSKSFSADDGSTELVAELSTQAESLDRLYSHHKLGNTLADYLSLANEGESVAESSKIPNTLDDEDYHWTDHSTLKGDKKLLQSTQVNSYGANVFDINQNQLESSSNSTELLAPIVKFENSSEYEADNLSYKSALKENSTSQINHDKLEASHQAYSLNQTFKSGNAISFPFPVDLTSDTKEIYKSNLNTRRRIPDLSTDNIRLPNEKWPFSRSSWSHLDKNGDSSDNDKLQDLPLASFYRKPQSQNNIKSISKDVSGEKTTDTKKYRHLLSFHSIGHEEFFTDRPQTTDTNQKVNLLETIKNGKRATFASLNINKASDKMWKTSKDRKNFYTSSDRVNYFVKKVPKNGNYFHTSLERKREQTRADFKAFVNILGKSLLVFKIETPEGRNSSSKNLTHNKNSLTLDKNMLQHELEDEETSSITEDTPHNFTTSYPTSFSSLKVLNKMLRSPAEKETAKFISDILEEKSANLGLPLDLQKDSKKLKEVYLSSGESETNTEPYFHSNKGSVTISLKTQPFLEDILFKKQSLHEPSRENEKGRNKKIPPENQSFYFHHKEFSIPDELKIKSTGTTIKKAVDIGHISNVPSDIYDVNMKGKKPTMSKNRSDLSMLNINVDVVSMNGNFQVSKKDVLTHDKVNEKPLVNINYDSYKDVFSKLSERISSLLPRSYPNNSDHDIVEVYLHFVAQNTSKSDNYDDAFLINKIQHLKDFSELLVFTNIQEELRIENITELADIFALLLVVEPRKRSEKSRKNTLPNPINHKEQFKTQKSLPSDSFASMKITLPSIATSEPMKSSLYDQQLSGSTETAWLDSEQAYDGIIVLDTFGEVPISSKKMEKENFHSKRAISRNWKILLNKPENVQGSDFVSVTNWLQEKPLFSQILENGDDIQQTEGKSSMVDTRPLMKDKLQSLQVSESRDTKSFTTENKNKPSADKQKHKRKKYKILDLSLLAIDIDLKEKNKSKQFMTNVSTPLIFSEIQNSEYAEEKKGAIEIADIYKSTNSLHGFDLNSAQVSNPLKSESSNSLTKEISSLDAPISPGNQELLLADQIVFPLEPDRKFSFELKVNNNASWVKAFNVFSISKDTSQQKTDILPEEEEEIMKELFSTSTLKANTPGYRLNNLENKVKNGFNTNFPDLKKNLYQNLLKPTNQISDFNAFYLAYLSSKKYFVGRETSPGIQHRENKPVSINSIFNFNTLLSPKIQENTKAEEGDFSLFSSFLPQATHKDQETTKKIPPVYTWQREEDDLSISEVFVPPKKFNTEDLHFKINASQPRSKSHTKRDIMRNVENSFDDIANITHEFWPWMVLILSGNLRVAAMRKLDFPFYLRLNLAARFDGSLNDYFVNNVTLYPILRANISVRTELYPKSQRTLCEASNVPLLRLNGYDFSVVSVMDRVNMSNCLNVLKDGSTVSNPSIWRQNSVLWSAIGTVACFSAVALILGVILHCHGTHEAEPFLIRDSVKTKSLPPPPVIYSRRLADEMNFSYFRQVFKRSHTKKCDKLSSLSAKLILNDSSYKNSFFE